VTVAEVRTYAATGDGGTAGTATLDASRLAPGKDGRRPNPVVLREAVLMYRANRRVGTVQTKERHFVSGTTKKMYKQKHTGNARQGDGKAPHFRGGGVAFGPHPRDFSYALPRKALKRALAIALARKVEDGEVVLVSGLDSKEPSTRRLQRIFDAVEAGSTPVVVTAGPADRSLLLSVRNIRRARVVPASEVNALDVASASRLLLLEGAFEALEARCAP
jgi:large subunit ribosomal protein L4